MEEEEECGLMPNVMAALRNIGGANEKRNFRNSLPCPTLQSLARVPCSNAANIGERKTWTQSNFLCTLQNSVRGQKPTKCIYCVPAQETARHRAKFGLPPLSDVGAVTKRRRETR